jgi:hypothetical protein
VVVFFRSETLDEHLERLAVRERHAYHLDREHAANGDGAALTAPAADLDTPARGLRDHVLELARRLRWPFARRRVDRASDAVCVVEQLHDVALLVAVEHAPAQRVERDVEAEALVEVRHVGERGQPDARCLRAAPVALEHAMEQCRLEAVGQVRNVEQPRADARLLPVQDADALRLARDADEDVGRAAAALHQRCGEARHVGDESVVATDPTLDPADEMRRDRRDIAQRALGGREEEFRVVTDQARAAREPPGIGCEVCVHAPQTFGCLHPQVAGRAIADGVPSTYSRSIQNRPADSSMTEPK